MAYGHAGPPVLANLVGENRDLLNDARHVPHRRDAMASTTGSHFGSLPV